MSRLSKEHRRVIEAIRSLMRRAPLSTDQRDRLSVAARDVQRERNLRTDSGRRRIFAAVETVACIALEIAEAENGDLHRG